MSEMFLFLQGKMHIDKHAVTVNVSVLAKGLRLISGRCSVMDPVQVDKI